MDCLDNFCIASSTKVSVAKTKLLCLKNTPATLGTELSKTSGFELGDGLDRYLGVQLFHGKLWISDYAYLVERTTQKLAGWKSANLSLTGRLTLIQSTLSTLPQYAMQSILLPKIVCNELDTITHQFLWEVQLAVKRSTWLNGTLYVITNKSEGWALNPQDWLMKHIWSSLGGVH